MDANNYRFPQVTGQIRCYWLEGKTGGQILFDIDNSHGHYNLWYYTINKDVIHSIMGANAYIDFEINLN